MGLSCNALHSCQEEDAKLLMQIAPFDALKPWKWKAFSWKNSLWLTFCPTSKPALHAGPVAAYTNRTGPCGMRFPLQNCTRWPLPIVKHTQMTTQAEFSSCPNIALPPVVCRLANSVCTRLQRETFCQLHVKILVKANTMLQGFSSTQGHAFSSWGATTTVGGRVWRSQRSM